MENSRRDFFKVAGGLAATGAFIGAPLSSFAAAQNSAGELTEHTLPPLPYDYNALEPYIDEQTMRLHHDKHHLAYVNGLNKAEAELAKARADGSFDLVQHWSRASAFHGAGHFLHSIFWDVMAPNGNGGGGDPAGAVADKLATDFGGVDAFRAHFGAAAKAVEGNGWGILGYRHADDRLVVLQAENHQKLTEWVVTPILCLDVWEHAYYLKYQNNRGEYVDQWWNVVNWPQVDKNLQALRAAFGK